MQCNIAMFQDALHLKWAGTSLHVKELLIALLSIHVNITFKCEFVVLFVFEYRISVIFVQT